MVSEGVVDASSRAGLPSRPPRTEDTTYICSLPLTYYRASRLVCNTLLLWDSFALQTARAHCGGRGGPPGAPCFIRSGKGKEKAKKLV